MHSSDNNLIFEAYKFISETSNASGITKVGGFEIKALIDDILGEDIVDDFKILKTEDTGVKFNSVIFSFIYKGLNFIKVFSNSGVNASKSDNGSCTVTLFKYPSNKETGNWEEKHTNAFYNPSIKDIYYYPIIRNGTELLEYVKSVLDDNNQDEDEEETIPQPTPTNKLSLVGV